jgi:uncharacterized protein YwgA
MVVCGHRLSEGCDLSNKERLASFLKALDEVGIICFNKKRFDHRLKLQKYVYIARNLGFKAPYNYSLYIHGPYSSSLADDYYAIDDFKDKNSIELDERFVKLVRDKSEKWLELASTIIMIRKRYVCINRHELIELVQTAKPYATADCLSEIIDLLRKYDLPS